MPVREFWHATTKFSGLDPLTVWEIRLRYHIYGESTKSLAERYVFSDRHVYRIVTGECYQHLPFPDKLVAPGSFGAWRG